MLNYLNWVSSCTMTCPHVSVTLGNSSWDTQIPVFPVHVMGSRPRVITKPNTKILNFNWRLFGNLFHRNDFTRGLLKFFQLSQEIPETGFGHDGIRSEDPHTVQWSVCFFLSGQFASNDFIFLQLEKRKLYFRC